MKFPAITTILFSSVALSACMTQPPAQVVMKGNNFYGSKNASSVQMASATPSYSRQVAATPNYKPYYAPPKSTQSAPVAPVQMATAEPRPSYGFKSSPSTTEVRQRAELGTVTVNDLEPLTASVAKPEPEATVAQAEPAPVMPQATPKAEVLPEPQARVVVENSTMPASTNAPAAISSKGFIWPVKGKVISQFGPKAGGEYNDGINISAREGEPIVAAADGEVVYSGNELRGYGNMVILRHDNGLMSAYAHADRVLVSKGETVRQGVTIATVGKSGGVDQAQVHFGVRKDKEPVDPMGFLSQNSFASR